MNKYEITKRIEHFAPVETAEVWDCVGYMVDTDKTDVSKIMLCLTVTEDIIKQAKEQNCDMIISHHPCFYTPLEWKDIDIYSAHTNLDRAKNGTTDTLIHKLGFEPQKNGNDYLRFVDLEQPIEIEEFVKQLKKFSPNLRYVNNKNVNSIKRIAFCAGSGSDFLKEAQIEGANALVTGDLKFHTAVDAEIVVFDIGHFESEILVLPTIETLISKDIEIIYAEEKSPFVY